MQAGQQSAEALLTAGRTTVGRSRQPGLHQPVHHGLVGRHRSLIKTKLYSFTYLRNALGPVKSEVLKAKFGTTASETGKNKDVLNKKKRECSITIARQDCGPCSCTRIRLRGSGRWPNSGRRRRTRPQSAPGGRGAKRAALGRAPPAPAAATRSSRWVSSTVPPLSDRASSASEARHGKKTVRIVFACGEQSISRHVKSFP